MIISSYHVFGSGSAWVEWSGDAESIVRFLAELPKEAVQDQGDNGFVGYKEVPDEIVPEGVYSYACAYPGGSGPEEARRLDVVKEEYASSKYSVPRRPLARQLASELSCAGLYRAQDLKEAVMASRTGLPKIMGLAHGVEVDLPRGKPPTHHWYAGEWEYALKGAYSRHRNPLPFLRQQYPSLGFRFLKSGEEPDLEPGPVEDGRVFELPREGERLLVTEED